MPKVLITTVPFGQKSRLPLELLEQNGIEYTINPYNKKLTPDQLRGLVPGFDAIIAGTELINSDVLANADSLKMISRVGVGLDSVDLITARNRDIAVSYTPDAPAPAVAELAVGLMLSMLRHIHIANENMHAGQWNRYFGRRLSEVTIGIIGVGRIGSKVLNHLTGFAPSCIMVNDTDEGKKAATLRAHPKVQWTSKEHIFNSCDVISIHSPLTPQTKNMITAKDMLKMKKNALLINTARGGIVNEDDLLEVLAQGHLEGVALDVFNEEPYRGPLSKIERCLLTSHMGSMSDDCRTRMEIEATEEAIRYLTGKECINVVPENEYRMQELEK